MQRCLPTLGSDPAARAVVLAFSLFAVLSARFLDVSTEGQDRRTLPGMADDPAGRRYGNTVIYSDQPAGGGTWHCYTCQRSEVVRAGSTREDGTRAAAAAHARRHGAVLLRSGGGRWSITL